MVLNYRYINLWFDQTKLIEMKILRNHWWLFLTIIIVTLIFIISYKGNLVKLTWVKDPFETLGQLVVKLIVVGALLDQLISVFFPENSENQLKRKTLETILKTNKANKSFYENELLRERLILTEVSEVELPSKIKNAQEMVNEVEAEISTLNANRTGYVRRVAFAFGLVLAITGITVLTDFITNIPSIESNLNFNHKLIYYLDIILTAALISGGTSGIEKFFRILKDAWKNNGVNP